MTVTSLRTMLAALFLSIAWAPARAITLTALPARPIEGTPVILAVGLSGSCPSAADVRVISNMSPPTVVVTLQDLCTTPPQPRLVEVPLGPLFLSHWMVQVKLGFQQESLLVEVQPPPFRLELDPPVPAAGSPFKVRLSGLGACPTFFDPVPDGNLLTLPFAGFCFSEPPEPQQPFSLEGVFGPLAAGDHVIQVVDFDGTIASARLHVAGPQECQPSDTALCLQQGRFRVEATWRTGTAEGKAHVRPETADSGSLWFFDPNNLEVLAKVLDACQSPSKRFWVFAAGLTDVEVELTVSDVPTNRVRTYRSPRGSAFKPILDTSAFDCPSTGIGGD